MMDQYPAVRPDSPYHETREITLVDLWLVLARYRLVILAATSLLAGIGALYSMLLANSYEYTASMQIGTRLVGDDYRLIESPDAVVARINSGYLPVLHRELAPERSALEISARSAGNSGLITLEGTAVDKDGELYSQIMTRVAERVIGHHEALSNGIRERLVRAREQAELRLEALDAEAQQLQARRKEVDSVERDLTSRGRELDGGGLLVYLSLTEQQKALQDDLVDTLARQREERALIAEYDAQLAGFTSTELLSPPLRSLEPVGPPRTAIILALALLGCVVGTMLALFLAFLQHVRRVQNAAG